MPDVSVIVTARNAQKTLPRCLNALQGQTLRLYADMEVIVIDCGSNDRTQEIALEFRQRHPAFVRVHRQTGADAFCAVQAGLALARGDYAAFCGAGEAAPPDMLRALFEACEQDGLPYAGGGGAKIWGPSLRGILARREFLLAHGLPVKAGGNRAEQLAAYGMLRQVVGPKALPSFCSDWMEILRGICLASYRESETSAAFYGKVISLANEPQAEEAMAHVRREMLDKTHRKFYDAFARRDWIRLEKMMRRNM